MAEEPCADDAAIDIAMHAKAKEAPAILKSILLWLKKGCNISHI